MTSKSPQSPTLFLYQKNIFPLKFNFLLYNFLSILIKIIRLENSIRVNDMKVEAHAAESITFVQKEYFSKERSVKRATNGT